MSAKALREKTRPIQLPLFAPAVDSAPAEADQAKRLLAVLSELLPAPARIILTDNRASIISVKKLKDRGLQVRLHRIFVRADAATLRALARFIRRPDRSSRQAMADFIRQNQDRIREKPASRRPVPHRSRGKVYELAGILDQVAKTYQLAAAGVKISWGQRSRKRKFRAIRFGSYDEEQKLIRVHPLLDRKEVPRFFVEYIVYHELLHAVIPDQRRPDGRRSTHHREFKRREQEFAAYREAIAFEKRLVREKWSRSRF